LCFRGSFRFAARPTPSAAGRTIGTFASFACFASFALNVVSLVSHSRSICDNAAMVTTVVPAPATLFESSAPPGVVSVYCFGSQSAGRAHRASDVDSL
jgi:hypothetical protein